MRAAILKAARQIQVTSVLEPYVIEPTDAIIRVSVCSVCGTDLHAYRGQLASFQSNCIMGHEFVGTVAEVGSHVTKFKLGDRVVSSDFVACGTCWYCVRNMHYHCKQVSLFGYGEIVGPYLPGGQAEWVRVPFADHVLLPVPDSVSDDNALLAGDLLSTAYACLQCAEVQVGDHLVIVGGGPLGLTIAACAQLFKPAAVYIVELNANRCQMARSLGATVLEGDDYSMLMERTDGRGADVVIEAVGSEATFQSSLHLVRPAGKVICAGAHHSQEVSFNTERAFAKETAIRFVVGNPMRYGRDVLHLLNLGLLDLTPIFTHRYSLEDIAEAYDTFDSKEAVKVAIYPGLVPQAHNDMGAI